MRPPIMMRRINVVLIFFTICLLSSCATSPSQPTVLTNTTAFFDDNYSSSGRIYLKNKYQIPKPMFEFYNQKIAKYLSLTGFEVMAEENQEVNWHFANQDDSLMKHISCNFELKLRFSAFLNITILSHVFRHAFI